MLGSDMDTLQNNYNTIIYNVEKAKERSGRENETVRIMAVTKTRGSEILLAAYRAGFRLFGENRVHEALEKFTDFKNDAELHIIGQLQSNKVKKAVSVSSCIQSVDRIKTASLIERFCTEFSKK